MDETAFLNDYNATSVTISANKITVSQPVADKDGNVAENQNLRDHRETGSVELCSAHRFG